MNQYSDVFLKHSREAKRKEKDKLFSFTEANDLQAVG
jgi:hypothetical protein